MANHRYSYPHTQRRLRHLLAQRLTEENRISEETPGANLVASYRLQSIDGEVAEIEHLLGIAKEEKENSPFARWYSWGMLLVALVVAITLLLAVLRIAQWLLI